MLQFKSQAYAELVHFSCPDVSSHVLFNASPDPTLAEISAYLKALLAHLVALCLCTLPARPGKKSGLPYKPKYPQGEDITMRAEAAFLRPPGGRLFFL